MGQCIALLLTVRGHEIYSIHHPVSSVSLPNAVLHGLIFFISPKASLGEKIALFSPGLRRAPAMPDRNISGVTQCSRKRIDTDTLGFM